MFVIFVFYCLPRLCSSRPSKSPKSEPQPQQSLSESPKKEMKQQQQQEQQEQQQQQPNDDIDGLHNMHGWIVKACRQHEERIKSQKYSEIRRNLQKNGTLFCDTLFPPEALHSVFVDGKYQDKPIVWRRPHEIVPQPLFMLQSTIFGDKKARFNVRQGKLNDCWLISALSVLTMRPDLLAKVVPVEQTFFDTKYTGMFYFNFYQYGEWITVVVDDRLPTYEEKGKSRLVLAHSEIANVFWIALLEKAYAKLCGGYHALNFGMASEAYVDLTGGVPEFVHFSKDSQTPKLDLWFYDLLHRYFLRNSLISVYIDKPDSAMETLLENGLLVRHSYALTGVLRIKVGWLDRMVRLIRLKNPWSRGSLEWNGAWSDGSPEWRTVSAEQKRLIGLRDNNDGEFWIEFDDFIKYFNVFECCHLNISSIEERYHWLYREHFGVWSVAEHTAGGCVNNGRESFYQNPKYLLTINEQDVDANDELLTVVIALSQRYFRLRKSMQQKKGFSVGFVLFHYGDVDGGGQRSKEILQPLPWNAIDPEFFRTNASIARVDYGLQREVNGRFRLRPGRYVVIPTTFEPAQEEWYHLRVILATSKENRHIFHERHPIPTVEINGDVHHHKIAIPPPYPNGYQKYYNNQGT